MTSSTEILAMRRVSDAHVSVGTSIALETILPAWPVFDPARIPPPKVKLMSFRYVYLNLWTLARNLHNALPTEGRDRVLAVDAASALVEEIGEIINAINTASAGSVSAVVYYPSYKSLQRDFPKAKLREPVTDKAKVSQRFLDQMCEYAALQLERSFKSSFKRFNVDIRPDIAGNTLMFTHFPVDLLSEKAFGQLSLLESHTGVVKLKNAWHTKLFNGKALSNIPLNTLTLQVFGDDHQMRPWEMKIKQALLDMAQQRRWSWATTPVKMKLDVRGHPDVLFAHGLASLL